MTTENETPEHKTTAWEFLLKVALIILVPIVALIGFLVSSVYNLRTEIEVLRVKIGVIEHSLDNHITKGRP